MTIEKSKDKKKSLFDRIKFKKDLIVVTSKSKKGLEKKAKHVLQYFYAVDPETVELVKK